MQTSDPWIKNFRANIRFGMILLPILIVIEIGDAIFNLSTRHAITFTPIFFLVVALFEIAAYVLVLSRRRVWRYHEQTRLRALSGDSTLLAPSQPASVTPITQPIKFPFVIEAHQRVSLVFLILALFLGILLLIAAAIFAIAIVATTTPNAPSSSTPTFYISASSLIIFGSACLAIIIAVAVLAIVFRRSTIHRIEATEQGLGVIYQNVTRSLSWDSLRFFSVSLSTNPHGLLYYELSSDDNYLHWFAIQSPSLARSGFYRPTTSFEQYQRDMQTLLALIQQKTNLPLYQLPPFTTFFPAKNHPIPLTAP